MGLWSWLKKFVDGPPRTPRAENRDDKERLIALVLFLRQPRYLDCATVADLAADAFRHVDQSRPEGNHPPAAPAVASGVH